MGKRILAFDFGASSGRAMLGTFDGEKISLTEIHRFSNDPVMVGKTFYWDALRLFFEIKQGILKAKQYGGFDSIGINTWGVDFGLLGKDGQLIENPVNYRDKRTEGMMSYSEKFITNTDLYLETGNQLMEINTAFQLLSLCKNRPHILDNAETLLMMPDLFNYFLTGEKYTELSIASTTQLLDPKTKDWNVEVMKKLGIPQRLFAPIIKSGAVVGMLSEEICEELGVERVPVIAVCEHDTQNAVMATPAKDKDFIFLSCGTWSLFGTELEEAVISETTCRLNLTNEVGFDGTVNLLNNIIGLWLIQESRRQWAREGVEYSFSQLTKEASEAVALKCFVNPDYADFTPAGNIPERIREYCKNTGQEIPQKVGEIVRCIYESLAMKYRYTIELLSEATGKDYDTIHIVGGGIKDKLLCQTVADICQKKVVAGPIEATVLGNIAIQLISHGEIEDISHARKIIRNSEETVTYKPTGDSSEINEAYDGFLDIMFVKETALN